MTTRNAEATLTPDPDRANEHRDAVADGLRWTFVRDALASTAGRFCELLRSGVRGDVPAVGDWTAGQTAAHVRVVALLDRLLATGAAPPPEFEDMAQRAAKAPISTVADEINRRSLEWEPRRDLVLLADVIDAEVERVLAATRASKGADTVHWLGGLPLPRTAVLGHLLSELLVHGHDIAAANHVPFTIPSSDAVLYFDGFMKEVVRNAPSVGFLDGATRDVGDVRWQLRLRGGRRMQFEYVDGQLQLDTTGPPDVRITADPAAMLLVMYDRVAPVGPALRGQLVVWGRRPWRLRRVTTVLRAP